MAYARPARPTNGHVAGFGKLEDAGESVIPADVHAGPHEGHDRAGAWCAIGRMWWPGGLLDDAWRDRSLCAERLGVHAGRRNPEGA